MTKSIGVGRGNNPASHVKRARASAQHRWNPGGSVASNGYVKIRVGKTHPLADPNGYAYEHHVVWCAAGNPKPARGQIIHHRNGDKTDNRLANLELMCRGAHNAEHLAIEQRRCAATGRLLPKRAGRLLDGAQHDGMPACAPCNLHKGGYTLEGWRDIIQRSGEIVGKQTSTFRAGLRFGVIVVSNEPVLFHFEKIERALATKGE